MKAATQRADAHASASDHARADLLERRLNRFQPRFRQRVRALAERHPRLKDLAASFPALLFALAIPRAGCDVARATTLVIDGAPLKDIAACAGVPTWLRPMKPDAFGAAIPVLPDVALFRRQIGNYLPVAAKSFDRWASAVSDAAQWADQAVALWVARELRRHEKKVELRQLRGVCLWAWYSRYGGNAGGIEIEKAWSPAMQFSSAVIAAEQWQGALDLLLNLGAGRLDDLWLVPGTVDGYEFLPLASAAEIAEEAATMKHCVGDYGGSVRHDSCRLWSVRRDDNRVATLEIGYLCEDPFPSVAQMNGAQNERVAKEVWLAARRWLNSHDVHALAREQRAWGSAPLDRALWTATWRPYWLAKKCIPTWLPLMPSRDALANLRYGERRHRRRRRRR